MTKVRCQFTIGPGWCWQSGPPIPIIGRYDQLCPNPLGDALIYEIEIPVDSNYWYVLPLAVFPNQAFGYGFVQLKGGKLSCRVEAIGPLGWPAKTGLEAVSFGDLALKASIIK